MSLCRLLVFCPNLDRNRAARLAGNVQGRFEFRIDRPAAKLGDRRLRNPDPFRENRLRNGVRLEV